MRRGWERLKGNLQSEKVSRDASSKMRPPYLRIRDTEYKRARLSQSPGSTTRRCTPVGSHRAGATCAAPVRTKHYKETSPQEFMLVGGNTRTSATEGIGTATIYSREVRTNFVRNSEATGRLSSVHEQKQMATALLTDHLTAPVEIVPHTGHPNAADPRSDGVYETPSRRGGAEAP